ncbi:MAG TPA: hypothetical protein VIF59_11975 [Methylomirabilota bacterium]|jgi:hypothetical protein
MSATGRILAGIVMAILVLGFAALELVSERVPTAPAQPQPAPAYLGDGAREDNGGAPAAVQQIIVLREGQAGGPGLEP